MYPGHLPDLKAAVDLIASFRKRFSTKACMAPQTDHAGDIVSAHALFSQTVLQKISVDGQVYAPHRTEGFSPGALPVELKRSGFRDVSVFNGFCAKHDADLFSCIENESFRLSRKQCFMLAYRTAARKCYLNRKECESFPALEEIQAAHGLEERLTYNEYSLVYQAASLRGAEALEGFKAKLDQCLIQGAWDCLVTHAVLFPHTPNTVASFVFRPFRDMNGTQVQDYEDLDAETSWLVVNLLPLDQGGAAIFSWLDSAKSAPHRFCESVIQDKNRTSSVIHAVLGGGENVAFAPAWYEALSEGTRAYLLTRILLPEARSPSSDTSHPDSSAPFLDDWGVGNVVQL